MRHTIALTLSLLIACLLGGGTSAQQGGSGKGPVILTLTGNITQTNRGPFDGFQESFFKFHGQEFQNAFAFDLETLRSLPQKTVAAQAVGWPRALRAKGPSLKNVLDAVGAKAGSSLTVIGLDGYTKEFTLADVKNHNWVLALDVDDKPLGLGGHGPAWLLYDSREQPASTEEAGTWVWSVFLISVK